MSDESEREEIAGWLDGGKAASTFIAMIPGAQVAGGVLAAAFGLAASLVRKLGTGDAEKTLREIRARVDAGEGTITAADIAADDARVNAHIDALFGPRS